MYGLFSLKLLHQYRIWVTIGVSESAT